MSCSMEAARWWRKCSIILCTFGVVQVANREPANSVLFMLALDDQGSSSHLQDGATVKAQMVGRLFQPAEHIVAMASTAAQVVVS